MSIMTLLRRERVTKRNDEKPVCALCGHNEYETNTYKEWEVAMCGMKKPLEIAMCGDCMISTDKIAHLKFEIIKQYNKRPAELTGVLVAFLIAYELKEEKRE